MPRDHLDGLDELYDRLKDIRFTMFTTMVGDRIRARPMTTIKTESDGTLWFFAAADSDVVTDIQKDPMVCLAYADDGSATYVSVAGTAQVSRNRDKARALWNPALRAWFEDADDPRLRLIEVDIDSAEYWDGPNNRLVRLVGLAASAITGHTYDAGEHGEVTVRP